MLIKALKLICRAEFKKLWSLASINYSYYAALCETKLFDKKYNVKTLGKVPVKELGLTEEEAAHAVYYQPSPIKTLRRILNIIGVNRNFIFIDLGCGLGRTLVVAAEFEFAAVYGVELSEKLFKGLRDNVNSLNKAGLKTKNFNALLLDAKDFTFPRSDTILYLYNPFSESVLRKVLENLKAMHEETGKCVYIIYFNPKHKNVLSEFDQFRLVYSGIPCSDNQNRNNLSTAIYTSMNVPELDF